MWDRVDVMNAIVSKSKDSKEGKMMEGSVYLSGG